MEATWMVVQFNSYLVAQQANKSSEVKGEKLKKYVEAYKQFKEDFLELVL